MSAIVRIAGNLHSRNSLELCGVMKRVSVVQTGFKIRLGEAGLGALFTIKTGYKKQLSLKPIIMTNNNNFRENPS